MEKLKKLILNNGFDLVGLSEVNKDWRRLKHEHTIWGATTGWHEHRRVQASYNTTKPPQKSDFLVGGTAMISFGDLVFRISKQDCDPRRLGRWSSMSFSGKNNTVTTIFVCYCPVRATSIGSAYSQQIIYMAEHQDKIPETNCPRQLFGLDLKQKIEEKIELGHQIIVMGDFNSEYKNLKKWMGKLGLIDLMFEKHGPCPPTHQRSHTDPLDCIFGSPSLMIARGGFLPFHKLISDHRGVWIDIPKILLYGYNPPAPIFPSARRLKTTDPRIVDKYLAILFQELNKMDLFMRMQKIHELASHSTNQQILDEYEEIYSCSMGAMEFAEKNCRKLRTGAHAWSPTYKIACLKLIYWLQRRSYFLKTHRNVRQLIVLQNKLGITYEPNLLLPEIERRIVDAHKHRHDCIKNDESLSIEYRTQLALAKEAAGELKAATFLKNQNYIEAQRRLFRNIRHMEGKIKGASTSKITIQSEEGMTEYTSKEDIERLCAKENERKWHQCEDGGSQLLLPPFINDLGHYGEGPRIEGVLNGTYVPPASSSPETTAYLSACRISREAIELERTQNDITSRFIDFKKSWEIRKESTCTHNLHIGHYKAAMKHKDVCWFLFQRSDFPEITGYSPKNHRQCVDLMIMKKTHCYELNKQRTIGILDTEYNQNNKKIGRRGMSNALSLDKVAVEQFAVKNTSAIEQIVSKRCIIDHHQSKRTCFALTSSDLSGCYDRIVHTAAALALLRVGIPHSRIRSMFGSIQRMVHRTRTMFGDSDLVYGGDDIDAWENYPQGVLQGNAAGPTIWVLVSSVIFEILHRRGFAAQICTSISKDVFKLVGFSYVDDCDLIQSGLEPVDVLTSMQSLLTNWGSLVEVTGGALSSDKSWWYLVEYVWKKGKWKACDAGEGLDLIAESETGEPISLRRLHAEEASEMLGVLIAPDGNTTDLVKHLQSEALLWGAKITSGNPSPMEAWLALHSNITAKLKYPLPACSLSQQQCKSILYPAIRSALPKVGMASNVVEEVRDGPVSCGGVGVASLYHYQGTVRTALLVEQTCKETTTGKLLRTCIEDLVLEAGWYGSLWQMPFDVVSKYISQHSLIFDIWRYNYEHKIIISTNHGELSSQRYGDISIMKLAHDRFTDAASLRSIQRVRMACGIVHLSDLCTADGRALDEIYLKSALPPPSKNLYDWPQKHRINRHDMAKWRRFVRTIFEIDSKYLSNPLGPWLHMDMETWMGSWDFFLSPDMELLWHKVSTFVWHRHLRKPNARRTYFTEHLVVYDHPHSELLRTTVSITPHSIVLVCSSPRTVLNPTRDTNVLHFGQIQVETPKINWFMDNLSCSTSTNQLLCHILQGSAIAVSDGSFFPNDKIGSCAWVVSTPDGTEFIKGGGLIPGPPQSQSSYRSELGGQLGLAAFISNIKLPPSFSTNITVACDGLAAIRQVDSNILTASPRKRDFDLVSLIKHIWETSAIQPSTKHVKGHQDSTAKILTPMEHLNCVVDHNAKQIARKAIKDRIQPPPSLPTSFGFGTIICNSTTITSNLQSSLYHQITTVKMLDWLARNDDEGSAINATPIHLQSYATARKEAPLSMKLFITKWISGDTATGKVMKRRKKRLLSNCPTCDAPDEHLRHILKCPSNKTSSYRKKLLVNLADWLKKSNTHPKIENFINIGLSKWLFTNETIDWPPESDIFTDCPIIKNALTSQLRIGWFYFLCGFLSSDFVKIQSTYIFSKGIKLSTNRWAVNLIKQLWSFLHAIWVFRNECLHQNDSVHKLTRAILLKQAITSEYNIGLGILPYIYSSYFNLPLQQLLKKNIAYLKRWFLIIRSGREGHNGNICQDIFSYNSSLRHWVKLKPLP